MTKELLNLRRLLVSITIALLIFLAASCGEEEEDNGITAPDDTTDTIQDPDTGFTYEPTQPPIFLAEGYKGTLDYTRPDQGFPVTTTDTVAFVILPDSFQLIFISHISNLCDNRGKLDCGVGDLTVLLTSQSLGGLCDSLRVPRGTMLSVYTESTLTMDTARNVMLPSGDIERVQYSFKLDAYNLFDSYTGTMTVDKYVNENQSTIEDSVTLTIIDSLYTLTVHTGTDLCSVAGHIEIDPAYSAISFAVDSTISDTTVCDVSLNLTGVYEADFRYNGVTITGSRYAPIPGNYYDSILIRLQLIGL